MDKPSTDRGQIADTLAHAAQDLARRHDALAPDQRPALSPRADIDAALGLARQLASLENAKATGLAGDPPGDYGLNLIIRLQQHAAGLQADELALSLQTLVLSYALWTTQTDRPLTSLEPLVNSLAATANRLRDPADLTGLCAPVAALVHSTRPQRAAGSLNWQSWRLLMLNWGIIATRSHRPELMAAAYQSITEALPEDAPGFFDQAMEQRVLLNYPTHVREVVKRYHRHCHPDRQLH